MSWKKYDDSLIGKVIYPFNKPVPHGLKLGLGETVIIQSKNEDWYYGYSVLKSTPKSSLGIFPCNYVKIVGKDENSWQDKERNSEISLESLKSKMLNTIVIHTSLWISDINSLQEENNILKFVEVEIHINKLIELFYEIYNWTMSKEKLIKFQYQLCIWINKINNLLNCDTSIRTNNLSILKVANLPLVQLEKLHTENLSTIKDKRKTIMRENSIQAMARPEKSRYTNLQFVVENFEFFGCSDEIVLEWIIIDTMNEWKFEPFWQSIKEVRKGRPPWMGEKFLFKDLPGEIKKDSVFVVVYVYRLGQLLADPNKQLTGIFRRPIAYGSSSLKEKSTINFCNLSETDFLKPTKEILRMKLTSLGQNRFVQISANILGQTETNLDEYDINHISENIYLRNDNAYESDRHCLYIRIDNAEFDRANKTSARNVEAQVSIRDLSGEKQPCIGLNPDVNNKTDYFTSVTYHCNSPRWKDLVKVDLNQIQSKDCHILVDFYHCTTKDKKGDERKHFGSCFIKLTEFFDCSVSSKIFTLGTQKISKASKLEPLKYLNGNYMISPDQEKNSLKEYCKINLVLCSTHLSSNKEINEFLEKSVDEDVSILQLRQCLKNIQLINSEDFLKPKLRKTITEMIKQYFLSKSCISLESIQIELFITWQMLSQKYITAGLHEELLCHLRGMFQFIDCLLKGVQFVVRNVQQQEISFETMATVLGCMEPIFMVLLTYSDIEYQFQISERIKEILRWNMIFFDGHYVSDPQRDIRKLIFDYTIENLKYFQNLTSIDVLLEYLKNLFLSQDFLDEKILAPDKLDFISKLMKSGIHIEYPDKPDGNIFTMLKRKKKNVKEPIWQDSNRSSLSGVSMFDFASEPSPEPMCNQESQESKVEDNRLFKKDVLLICFNPTIEICTKLIDTNSPHLIQVVEILSNMFNELKQFAQEDRVFLFSQKLMKKFFTRCFSVFTAIQFKDQQKSKYLPRQESEEPASLGKHIEGVVSLECQKMYTLLFCYLEEWCDIKKDDIELIELCIVLNDVKILLELIVYPKRWLSIYLKIASIADCILKKSTEYLQNKNEDVFNKLVPVFFEACYVFIMQDHLQLQYFPLSKAQKIIDEYGDMRINVVDCFLLVWKIKPAQLNSFDKSFTVQTTMRVLNISFLNVSGIRRKTIPVLLHTIAIWIDKCEDINEVHRDFISEAEILLRDGRGDVAYYDLLSNLIKLGKMQKDVSEVIENFTNLLDLHLEHRKLSGPKSNNKLHSLFLLHAFMKFYQDQVNIFTHFQHYSQKFSQMLEGEEHFFEAALVLKQQYDCILWNTEQNDFDDIFFENFEGTSNEQHKEQLRLKILDLLNLTKEYEYAAELCKELYKHYLTTFKYKELGSILMDWANYYHMIMEEPRLTLNYYRVTFIGGILPSYMKPHRDYIIKGTMWFKMSSVKTVLHEAFPDAEIQFYQSNPPVESPYEQNMIIYLAKMEPIPIDLDFRKNRKISTKIRNFYKDHRINKFISDHPFHKGTIDKDNEIKTLHICRVVVMTEIMMPNLFMWNPIIYEERTCLTPIEVAIDTVSTKNQTIRDVVDEYEEHPNKDLRPFTMLLTGTLDAGVNGGMPKYIDAFFSENSEQEMEINMEHINCFREVLMEQKNVLNEALALHKKLAPPQIQPMHGRLEECFSLLSKTVMDLNVFKKRSFSKINSVNDVYFGTSEISFDSPTIESRDFNFFRESSMFSEKQRSCPSESTNRSSNETTSSCNYDNCNPRQSHSSSERIRCRDLIGSSSTRRKVSSTDEEMITKLAHEYMMRTGDLTVQPMIPSVSTPDISSKGHSSSIEDIKNSLMISPPLPPSNKECANQINKSKTKTIWKRLTIRKGSKDIAIVNPSDGAKISFTFKSKPKFTVMDIFEPLGHE